MSRQRVLAMDPLACRGVCPAAPAAAWPQRGLMEDGPELGVEMMAT